jgi:hypothetical protein
MRHNLVVLAVLSHTLVPGKALSDTVSLLSA